MAESLFATLEHELLRQNDFVTSTEALWSGADSIENFYSHERIHSALDYDGPISYEESYQAPKSA